MSLTKTNYHKLPSFHLPPKMDDAVGHPAIFGGKNLHHETWRPKVDKVGPNVAMIKLQIGHQAASYQRLGLTSPPKWFFHTHPIGLCPSFLEHFDVNVPLVALYRCFFQSELMLMYSSPLYRFIGAMSKIPVVSFDTSQASLSPVSAISFNMSLVLSGFSWSIGLSLRIPACVIYRLFVDVAAGWSLVDRGQK